MSFSGLILTNEGRNKIAASISNEIPLKFSYIQLGDGVYNGSCLSKKDLTNMVMQIPITRVQRENNEVLIECDWSDRQAPTGFYLREIGIFSDNDTLCYYDNAGIGDAEYIDPDSDVITKEKRFRFTVIISEEVNVTTQTLSGLYALKEDIENIDKIKVDKEPGKVLSEHNFTTELLDKLNKIDNTPDVEKPVSVPVQEALDAYYAQLTAYTDKAIADLINGAPTTLDTLKELADAIQENQSVQEALDAAIGTKANQKEFDSHVATVASATVTGHVKVDTALSGTSTNPVQNKVVKATFDDIWKKMYPVGAIYISVVNTSPATLFGGTWEQITSGYLRAGTSYATKTDGSNTATGAATGNTGSTTLTAAQSGVPAHSHGLNSHTHTLNSHTHGAGTLGTASSGSHSHNIHFGNVMGATTTSITAIRNPVNPTGNMMTYSSSDGSHTHTLSGSTGAASGNTGAASGNTANNTGTAASSGHTHTLNSHTHPINLNYVQVYMWKRTA